MTSGTRRLLRFRTETRNLGPSDLVLGSPINNPLFHFEECHGHYHFEEFMDYRLVNETGVVAVGNKPGFCLLDTFRFETTAPLTPKYHCLNQGMQAGWGDIYGATLPCQWIDVTDVEPGNYFLEMEVNPQHLFDEANFDNNVAVVPVFIPELILPDNDECPEGNAVQPGVYTGITSSATNDGSSSCGSSSSTPDVWYSYTPATSGATTISLCASTFDTNLSVHYGCPGTATNQVVCNDDGNVPGCASVTSRVTMFAEAGTTYRIRISGYLGDSGAYMLTLSGPPAIETARARDWEMYP